ncbi:MAG: NAD(P)-binding protein [Eubacteriales bacterium]|nr:NAD(P)-binding protein [Eubacteriales bacterium]
MSKYDYIVVGAGNAGLSASLTLILQNKKVLLIEQNNSVGGCATSFIRGRFEFDPSLHELCDFGSKENKGTVQKLFDSFSIDLDWIKINDCFRLITKGYDNKKIDVVMPSKKKEFINKMEYYVPNSKEKMIQFFDLLKEINDGLEYLTLSNGKYDTNILKEKYPNLLICGSYSSKKVFEALKLPKECQDILSAYWPYLGVDLERMSFLHYAVMIFKYIEKSAYIPKNTSNDISLSLFERFKSLGGCTLLNTKCEKILFENREVKGIVTNNGTFESNYVLANINPDILYGKMIPKNVLPDREKRLSSARNRHFSGRMLCVYLGLNKDYKDIGIKDYSIFLPSLADSKKEYLSMQNKNTNNFSIFLCYNVVNADASPKGTCICSFTTMCGRDDFGYDMDLKDYYSIKESFAKKMINSLRENANIDISPYIEEISIASPLTFARYLNAPEGSVYGYEPNDWDSMIARMMSIKSDYPIKGLYPIGTSGPRGNGYSSTYVCGNLIANLALGDEKNAKN